MIHDKNQIIQHYQAIHSPVLTTILSEKRKKTALLSPGAVISHIDQPEKWYFSKIDQIFIKVLEFGDKWQTEGGDTYHNLLFLDDLNRHGLSLLWKWSLQPAAIIETSPGNFQVWLKLPYADQSRESRAYRESLKKPGRRAIERFLVSLLRQNGGGGDRRAATGVHTGRLGGTWNPEKKPLPARGRQPARAGRPGCLAVLIDASGHTISLDVAQRLIAASDRHAQQVPSRLKTRKAQSPKVNPYINPDLEDAETFAPDLDYEYEDLRIIEAAEYLEECEYSTRERDLSGEDFFFCSRLARVGFSEDDVRHAFVEYAWTDLDRKPDRDSYVETTVTNAFNDDEVDRIYGILEHQYQTEIESAYKSLLESCTSTNPDHIDWFCAGRLAYAGFSAKDIKKVLAENPVPLVRHKFPASYIEKTVAAAIAKYAPKRHPQPQKPPRNPFAGRMDAVKKTASAKLASQDAPRP